MLGAPYHPINWSEARVLDHATRATDLALKESLYIQMTAESDQLNQNEGHKILGCWITTMKLGEGLSGATPYSLWSHVALIVTINR